MTKNHCSTAEIMKKLQEPFSSKDIEWRVSHSGISNGKPWAMVLAYVTNRAIQTRLDEVFGPGGWKNEYESFQDGIICRISCFINGEWITKEDGAEKTQVESFKGGLSSAMKRAAVQWGIGRYLYDIESTFVEITQQKVQGANYINDKKNNVRGYWLPPKLPDWALPENERGKSKGSGNINSKPLLSKTVQRNNNQTEQRKDNGNSQGFNRRKAISYIAEVIQNTQLKPNWVIPLFQRVNPQIQQKTLDEVFQKATNDELTLYVKALRPVNDLVKVSNFYEVPMEKVLEYVQILLPEHEIKSLQSCFTHVTVAHVKKVVEFIKEDLEEKRNNHKTA